MSFLMDHSVKAYNKMKEGQGERRSLSWKEKAQATYTVFPDLQENHSWEQIHLIPKIDRIKME